MNYLDLYNKYNEFVNNVLDFLRKENSEYVSGFIKNIDNEVSKIDIDNINGIIFDIGTIQILIDVTYYNENIFYICFKNNTEEYCFSRTDTCHYYNDEKTKHICSFLNNYGTDPTNDEEYYVAMFDIKNKKVTIKEYTDTDVDYIEIQLISNLEYLILSNVSQSHF
uniref:Uncharacterized protein n=1 Tax=Pithovirus LCDPAC02 TaxID=2506601 RepID=A0A481YQD7_9VIRU|nr:MAG: hypothetical protein LCDPAC02_01940 [Pithovirus LCDPAC02]